MNGEYTRDGIEEFSKKLSTAIKANFVLQELKKYIDYHLQEIEPQDWPNISFIRKLIIDLEADKPIT